MDNARSRMYLAVILSENITIACLKVDECNQSIGENPAWLRHGSSELCRFHACLTVLLSFDHFALLSPSSIYPIDINLEKAYRYIAMEETIADLMSSAMRSMQILTSIRMAFTSLPKNGRTSHPRPSVAFAYRCTSCISILTFEDFRTAPSS